jgi:hypothetical protein
MKRMKGELRKLVGLGIVGELDENGRTIFGTQPRYDGT